jgi:hypothetical protein
MHFSLVKAIKSSHRTPINKTLHTIGLPIYVVGLSFIIGYFARLGTSLLVGFSMWLIAVCLFLLGHYIEGNLRAITPVIIYKYLRSRIQIEAINGK